MDYQKPPVDDAGAGGRQRILFPPWANKIAPALLAGVAILGGVLTFIVWYYFSPKNTDVGYAPVQPAPYSHKQHAGDLGMDCRYCHVNVERSSVASVPPTQVCMNCHSIVRTDSKNLALVRDSFATGKAIPWVRIHKTPDFAYFDHSRHVKKGVACVSCHGRIDQMVVVRQKEPLSMAWCLDCHRNPAPNVRPPEEVTNMAWQAPNGDAEALGKMLVEKNHINPPTDCSGCHR